MKKIISLALTIALVFAITISVFAMPAPKSGYPMWDDSYKGRGASVDPSVSARTDASGDKIPSNAHSGDVYGLYFYWDDNNKSVLDGTLLVADEFFDLLKGEEGSRSFTVTAKNSNAYWDYEIVEGKGNVVAEGVSAYKIPRFFMYAQTDKKTGAIVIDKKTGQPVMVKDELKNINMIFISGDWVDGYVIIEKVWLDKDGNEFDGNNGLVSFNNSYVLGENTIEIASLSGKTVTVLENPIDGFTTLRNPISVKVKPGETKTITFYNQEDYIPPKFGVALEKWVDGQFIIDWAASDFEIDDLMGMMSFKIYSVNGPGGDIVDSNFIADGGLTEKGVIAFEDLEVVEGWYAIVEELTDEGRDIFEEPSPLYIYVNELGIYESEPVAWVSGKDFGVPVIHDGSGVNYILPNVWDGVLSGQPAYEELKKMGAQWVWDVEDTYVYGVSGSVYEEEFTFTANEAGSVTGYLAADNAAVVYVNGKLAGFTKVAFNTPGNQPTELLSDFNYGALDAAVFDGGWATGWNYSYSFGIDYNAGENTVTIIAANSARTYGTGTANDGYDTTNNPCGLIFGFITPPSAVFNNYAIPPTPPKDPINVNEKITSKEHCDLWWAEYGIIAYGASSNEDKEDYAFAFSVDFWDKYKSVTFGFGTENDRKVVTVYLDDGGNLASVDGSIIFRDQQIGGDVFFGNHHTGETSFDISICAYFDNPHGSGAKHIWLLTIQP